MAEAKINMGYELYQIITDFGEPLEIFREAFQNAVDANATKIFCHVHEEKGYGGGSEKVIIDIWNNGDPLEKKYIDSFFGLAMSTKVDPNNVPIKGKMGYKGHGSKIFFNAEKIQICSKSESDEWVVELDSPLKQLEEHEIYSYSEPQPCQNFSISLPSKWEKGFLVRIIAPHSFDTTHTRFKLDHIYLRDYIKWYTVIGTIRTLYDAELKEKNITLYLSGLHISNFSSTYTTTELIDPVPVFKEIDTILFEEISLGHYFPPERYDIKPMKDYAKSINSHKAYYDYYSRLICHDNIKCSNGTSFRLYINLEGYETKRKYDVLLSKRGKTRTELIHTDSERYGLWVCKDGVPIEKVDHWIEGGKGSGSYTYMQAFIDCEDFQLTANRGSIRNTSIEHIEAIKKQLNLILDSSKIKKYMIERSSMEQSEKSIQSADNDAQDLNVRHKLASNRKIIQFPDGTEVFEPSKLTSKTGYSESETLILLIQIITKYPNLFPFKLLDYNTTKGIDFVVEKYGGYPLYIELKGTLSKKINHPFKLIDQFICYDIDIVLDMLDEKATVSFNKNDTFESFDDQFKGLTYKSCQLIPSSANIKSMKIISLKEVLLRIIGAQIL